MPAKKILRCFIIFYTFFFTNFLKKFLRFSFFMSATASAAHITTTIVLYICKNGLELMEGLILKKKKFSSFLECAGR